MKKLAILSLFLIVISSCTSMKESDSSNRFMATGTIEKLGISTFQYGTHLLKSENKTYALKSSSIKLDDYLNKKVTVKGTKVTGYPLDGGPELIEVTMVKL